MRYIYFGDKLTAQRLHNMPCDPVRRADGKCIVGRGSALVADKFGRKYVVLRRRLRLKEKLYSHPRPIQSKGKAHG